MLINYPYVYLPIYNSFYILNISDPFNPFIMEQYNFEGIFFLKRIGNYIFGNFMDYSQKGIIIFDISNPAELIFSGRYFGLYPMEKYQNYALGSEGNALSLINLEDLENISEKYILTVEENIATFYLEENLGYILDASGIFYIYMTFQIYQIQFY